MELFNQALSSEHSDDIYLPKNEQEAWIAVIYACMAADEKISEHEIDKLGELLVYKVMFRGHELKQYYKPPMIAYKQLGSKGLIDSGVSKISDENKPTLFAITLDLLLSDGVLRDKEKEIIEYLSSALNIEEILAQNITKVLLIKNKGNVIIKD